MYWYVELRRVTYQHDPEKEESVRHQQNEDWYLVCIEICISFLQKWAGKESFHCLKIGEKGVEEQWPPRMQAHHRISPATFTSILTTTIIIRNPQQTPNYHIYQRQSWNENLLNPTLLQFCSPQPITRQWKCLKTESESGSWTCKKRYRPARVYQIVLSLSEISNLPETSRRKLWDGSIWG